MPNKLFIPILLGTVRQGRQSEYVANFLFDKMQKHEEIETALLDPRKMHLPMDDEGTDNLKDKNPEYRDAIMRADGLVIVSPEYNHGYPGSLKRALDILLKEYIHKAVGIVGVSSGRLGGARMIEHLLQVVRELGLVATFTDLTVSNVEDAFGEKGELHDEKLDSRADKFLEELLWMSKTLRWGRENVSSKYHKT